MNTIIVLDLKNLFTEISGETAKLADLEQYIFQAIRKTGEGNTVILTGGAPIWLYLKVAHALHGKVKRLLYSAPGQGIQDLEIFSHDPF
jgi:hypothetical protein